MKHNFKKATSWLLTLAMTITMLPGAAFAAEDTGLCDHHTEHTPDCGYVAAAAEVPCGHEHTAECYTAGVLPDSDSFDVYETGEDTNVLNCQHQHDETCGYSAAVEAHPCRYECVECAEKSETPTTEVCTCETKCAESAINADCPVCADEDADLSACTGEEHTYNNGRYHTDAEYHYAQCDSCSYYKSEGEAHILTGEEGADKTCSTCGYIAHNSHNYVWDGNTWDAVDHWVECSGCESSDWQSHFDGDDEDRNCDVCGLRMDCEHDSSLVYDESDHWESCEKCGAYTSNKVSHSFGDGHYYKDTAKHYPECYGCYYKEAEGEDHVDEDRDTNCDVCGYWIHDHDFGSNIWFCDNGKHSPWCDLCGNYIEELGEACTDDDGDHGCDKGGSYMEWLCYDEDNDHICDVELCNTCLRNLCRVDNNDEDKDHVCDTCGHVMDWLCSDVDNNHVCVTCGRKMVWECTDNNNDWYCDTCGRDLCDHWYESTYENTECNGKHIRICGNCTHRIEEDCWFAGDPEPNNDGTHNGTCGDCGAEIEEDCSASEYVYDETTHTGSCRCGYIFPTGEHTYEWFARSMTGHWLYCLECNHEKWETHTTTNGTCEVCDMQVSAYADVYVGGVGLKDGEYLDNSGTVSTTQPTGGYAYYSNGVLELNGYVYEGIGILWNEYGADDVDYASIYATTDLTLVLTGENSLKTVLPGEVTYESGDGIAAQQDLTIRGEGSLTIQAEDDGIDLEEGDLIIEGGTLTVNSDDDGIDLEEGDLIIEGGTLNVYSGDKGIDMVEGDLIIEGGTLNICSGGDGIEVDGGVTVTGGTVTVVAEEYGLDCESNVTISDGTVTIVAEEYGLDCESSVTISGGTLNITTMGEYSDGIYAEGDVTIENGGTVDITTAGQMSSGIYVQSGSNTTLGGVVTIATTGQWSDGIYADGSVTIDGMVTITTEGVLSHGIGLYADYNDNAIHGAVTITTNGVVVITTGGEYSDGIYAEPAILQDCVTIGGEVKITAPNGNAFNRKPVIGEGARVWYGDSEDTAEFAFGEPASDYYTSKYVRIVLCDLRVGGEQVTNSNLSGEGWSYDPETNTLTLTNAEINNADGEGIKATGDLTISGTGTVTGSTYGIYVDGMLSIEAGSVITMTGTENCALAVRDGILTDNVIVSVPEDYAMGSVDVGAEEEYTTYGTRDEEYEFTPATTVKFEPGYVVYFDVGESMDWIDYQEVVAGGKAVKPDDPTLDGYTFGGWYTDEACTEAYDFDAEVTEDLWLYAKWTKNSSGGDGGYVAPPYSIRVEDAANGEVKVNRTYATSGSTVTITVTPDSGYTLETLTVTTSSGKEVELTNKGNGTYTFEMPGSKVTVTATFMDDITMLNFFVDVPADAYYYNAVLWAAKSGITSGTTETTFSPNDPCTRAQMATFLWRAAGSPEPVGEPHPFTDIPADAYYAKAVQWAYEQGITGGTSATTFSPDDTCTRGQMATFLWRRAGSPAMIGSAMPFTDVPEEKYYAIAVQWAYEQGITSGTGDGTTFSPDDPCTRAQMVTFLYRFFEEE